MEDFEVFDQEFERDIKPLYVWYPHPHSGNEWRNRKRVAK